MQWVPRPHHCHLKLKLGHFDLQDLRHTCGAAAPFSMMPPQRASPTAKQGMQPAPGKTEPLPLLAGGQSAAPGYRVQRPLSDGVEVDVGLDEGMACHPWSSAWVRLRHFTALKNFKLLNKIKMAPASTPHHATGRLRGPGDGQVAGIHNMSSTWAYSGAWMATPISNRRGKNNTAPSSTPTALRAAAAEPWRHT